jgi:uncharacterized Tic20 family protein
MLEAKWFIIGLTLVLKSVALQLTSICCLSLAILRKLRGYLYNYQK